jgi:hypothetical protein
MEEAHNFDAFQAKRRQQQTAECSDSPEAEAVCVRRWLSATLKRRYLPHAPLQQNLDAVSEQLKSLKCELRQCLHSLRLALRAPDKGDTPIRAAPPGQIAGEASVQHDMLSAQVAFQSELKRLQGLAKVHEEQLLDRNHRLLQLQLVVKEKDQQHELLLRHLHQQQHQAPTEHTVQIRFLRESLCRLQQQQHVSTTLLSAFKRCNCSLKWQKVFLSKALAYSSSFVATVSRNLDIPVAVACLSPRLRMRACVLVVIAVRRLVLISSPLSPPPPASSSLSSATAATAAAELHWQCGSFFVDDFNLSSASSASIYAAAASKGADRARSAVQVTAVACAPPYFRL